MKKIFYTLYYCLIIPLHISINSRKLKNAGINLLRQNLF